jgi:hypothetical protein
MGFCKESPRIIPAPKLISRIFLGFVGAGDHNFCTGRGRRASGAKEGHMNENGIDVALAHDSIAAEKS